MKRYSVDRIVEKTAVLVDDDGNTKEVSVSSLPSAVKESDILIFDGTDYRINEEETKIKKEEVRSLIDSLFH